MVSWYTIVNLSLCQNTTRTHLQQLIKKSYRDYKKCMVIYQDTIRIQYKKIFIYNECKCMLLKFIHRYKKKQSMSFSSFW